MTRRALVVSSQIEGLRGADRDATRIAAALAARDFAVDLRQGPDATRAGILDGLAALTARSTAGDGAFVFYAGHGSRLLNPDPRAGDPAHPDVPAAGGFLVPTDYRAATDDDFRGISTWELAAQLAALTRRTDDATIVLDCCFAAQLLRDPTDGDAQVRTLPHPHRRGLGPYLAALIAQGVALTALDPLGDARAIRLSACGADERAMELPTPDGHTGALTDALLWLLDQLGDAPLSWALAGAAIRQRVQRRFPHQRPVLGGPTARALFSTTVLPHRAVAVTTSYGRPIVTSGHLTGTCPGDTFAIVPLARAATLDAADIAQDDVIATATVNEVSALTSFVALDHRHGQLPIIPDGAVALPLTRQLPPAPIAIAGDPDDADLALVHAWIAATPRLAVTDATTTAATSDSPPIATVVVAHGTATIVDAIGPLAPPIALAPATVRTAARARLLDDLTTLAAAHALHLLDDQPGVPATAASLSWAPSSTASPTRSRSTAPPSASPPASTCASTTAAPPAPTSTSSISTRAATSCA